MTITMREMLEAGRVRGGRGGAGRRRFGKLDPLLAQAHREAGTFGGSRVEGCPEERGDRGGIPAEEAKARDPKPAHDVRRGEDAPRRFRKMA